MPRVLIVHPGGPHRWAFDYMAHDVARFAPAEYVVTVVPQSEFEACVRHCGPKCFGRLDAAFHFSLSSASILRRVDAERRGTLVANEGHLFTEYDPADYRTLPVQSERNAHFARNVVPQLDFVICLTDAIHKGVREWTDAAVKIPQGVNTLFWRRQDKGDDAPRIGQLRVGWCGDKGAGRSHKGWTEVFKPLVEAVGSLEAGIEWHVNDRSSADPMNRSQMRKWYNDLDMILGTAVNEGGPYPPFEAACCGVPFVSTQVGQLAEWVKPHELGCIIPPYQNEPEAAKTVQRLKEKLRWFRDHRTQIREIGLELMVDVAKHYSWAELAPLWLKTMVGGDE